MKLFKFLTSLIFLHSFVVDDGDGGSSNPEEGAGAEGKEPNDGDGGSSNPEEGAGAGAEGKEPNDETGDNDLEDIKKQLDDLRGYKEKKEQEEAVSSAVNSIKSEYPDFDESKVIEHLKNIAKTDPAKADALNNPVGWENIWLKEFNEAEPTNDYVGFGRNSGSSDFSDIESKIENGEYLTDRDEDRYFYKDLV